MVGQSGTLLGLQKTNLRQQAVTALRTAITSGELRPRSALVETELSERLQISRGTLREALRQLQQEGLVVTGARGRLHVRHLDTKEIQDIFSVRAALEGLAAAEIAKHAERARIVADLRAALDLMGKAPKDETLDARIEADLDFHRLLCRSADNETLLHSWSNLEGSIRMSIMYAGRDRAVGNMDADRHHEIVDAIETMGEAAAECYEVETGNAFIPASGSRASVRAQETGAVFEAKQLLEQHDRETAAKSKVEGVPLIVSGATDWTDIDVIFRTLDKVRDRIKQNRNQDIFICHKGGKHGAEMIAARWARARGINQARFDPRWSAHGRAAPFKCNDEMLDDKFAATGVVLFGGNGVALNLGQKAEAKGLTVMRVADPAKEKAEA